MVHEHSGGEETGRGVVASRSFDAFVDPHLAVLWRVARSLARNPDDADDLVQDTLVRAYRGLDRFDGAHPRAWLLTIMRNAHINQHRRQRPGLLRDQSFVEAADRHNPMAPSAEELAIRRSHIPGLADALARLSPRHLDVIRLVDIEGLTYDEAAAALGIPTGTVMSRVHRARHRLRAQLTRQLEWSGP